MLHWANLAWNGPASAAMVGEAPAVEAQIQVRGAASLPLAVTISLPAAFLRMVRLVDPKNPGDAFGLEVQGQGSVQTATVRGRARPSLSVAVNSLSQDDVAGALQTMTIEPGMSFLEAMRLILAFAAGDGTGLNGPTAVFKSQDGTKDRITASIAGGTRNVTAVDPS